MSNNILWDIFMIFWSFLDIIFIYIDNSFRDLFPAIPSTAIQFLIGIFCYSMITLLEVFINRQEIGNEKVLLKFFHRICVIIVVLFAIWRFGFIFMLEDKISYQLASEFFINIIYIAFAIVLIISFMKRITWLSKAIIALLWFCLLIITLIIAPAFNESVLSQDTLVSLLIIAAIFIVPNSWQSYQQKKNSGIGEKE